MRLPHLTSLWPHLFTPFTQKMSEVLVIEEEIIPIQLNQCREVIYKQNQALNGIL